MVIEARCDIPGTDVIRYAGTERDCGLFIEDLVAKCAARNVAVEFFAQHPMIAAAKLMAYARGAKEAYAFCGDPDFDFTSLLEGRNDQADLA